MTMSLMLNCQHTMYKNRTLSLVNGASIRGIGNEILFAANVISSMYFSMGYDCMITSGVNGEHSRGSEHYKGDALDFRTRHMRAGDAARLTEEVRIALGKDFDVVLERTHLHVEYDPKTPLNKVA